MEGVCVCMCGGGGEEADITFYKGGGGVHVFR